MIQPSGVGFLFPAMYSEMRLSLTPSLAANATRFPTFTRTSPTRALSEVFSASCFGEAVTFWGRFRDFIFFLTLFHLWYYNCPAVEAHMNKLASIGGTDKEN
jgi:hypothetical protein